MINQINDSNHINFCSKRLYKIPVKKLCNNDEYRMCDAYFSKLDINSIQDKEAVNKIGEMWGFKDYLKTIVNSFHKNDSDTYCIEVPGKEPLYKRIKAIMSRVDLSKYDEGNDMLATELSAAPSVEHSSSNLREYKNVGKAAIIGTVRLTKDKGLDRLLIKAENENFFNKIGINKITFEDGEEYRFLTKEDFDNFLK